MQVAEWRDAATQLEAARDEHVIGDCLGGIDSLALQSTIKLLDICCQKLDERKREKMSKNLLTTDFLHLSTYVGSADLLMMDALRP